VINLIVYLALAPWLIAQHGASGAALATTVMEGLNTLMQLVVVYQLLHSSHAAAESGKLSA